MIANLGVVASRLGRGFKWDAAKMKAMDYPEAAAYINPAQRKCAWL